MDRLKELLIAIKGIVAEDHAKQIEQTKHGEKFNIFKVLKAQRNEMLHSAFIAELLNPKGSHGANDTFLQIFKTIFIDELIDGNGDICSNEIWAFDTENAAVYIEYDIDENGRIDILIENNGKGIIIENKIDASDQKGQLFRYNKFAKSRYGSEVNYKIIYLTLEGIDASEESLENDNKIDYIRASYRDNIKNWISKCIEKSARLPFVRETLLQYIVNLKEIFAMMNEDSITKLAEIASSENFIDSTLAIIKNQTEIRKQIIKDFVFQMEKLATKYKLTIDADTEGLCNLKDNTWIALSDPQVSQKWGLFIGAFEHIKVRDGGVRFGIASLVGPRYRLKKEQLALFEPIWSHTDDRKYWPLGWEYLGDGNEKFWWNWKDDWATLRDMAKGDIANWIENEILAKGWKKWLRKIEKCTTKQ